MTDRTRLPSPFVRLTILGTRRNADLVLPTREPLHVLLPSILDLLDEPDRLAEYEIAAVEGGLIDLSRPLSEAGVDDGQLLRLTPTSETPSDPEVYDVVETTQAYSTRTRGLWDADNRPAGAALVAGVLLAAVGLLWHAAATPPTTPTLTVAASAAAALAALAAVARQVAPSWLAWVTAVGLATWALSTLSFPAVPTVTAVAIALALAGLCSHHWRALTGAAGCLVAVAAAAGLARRYAGDDLRAAAVVGVLLVIAIGLVPRLALGLSGVFRLDADVTGGQRIRLHQARRAVEEAHWTMAATVSVLALAMTAVAWVVWHQRTLGGWQLAIVVLLAVSWSLRGRHLPLVIERVACALGSAALAAAVASVLLRSRADLVLPVVGASALVAAAIALWHLVPLSSYAAAIARRWTDRLEAATVIALLPVLVGAFGIYADLVRSFS